MARYGDPLWACMNKLMNLGNTIKLCEFLDYLPKHCTPCSSSVDWYVRFNFYNAIRQYLAPRNKNLPEKLVISHLGKKLSNF